MIQIAIDTNGVSGSGHADLVAGADTRSRTCAQWEYLLQTRFGSGNSNLNVWHGASLRPGRPRLPGRRRNGRAVGAVVCAWDSAGPPSTPLRFTVATFRSTAADQTQEVGGATVPDALDVVTDYGDPRTTGYPNTTAEFTSDQRIDYFSKVFFYADGRGVRAGRRPAHGDEPRSHAWRRVGCRGQRHGRAAEHLRLRARRRGDARRRRGHVPVPGRDDPQRRSQRAGRAERGELLHRLRDEPGLRVHETRTRPSRT